MTGKATSSSCSAPPLSLTVIHACERVTPPKRERNAPEATATAALTDPEIAILRKLRKTEDSPGVPTVAQCVTVIAKLGGYLARGSDPPPGNLVIWRGLSRLTDIHLGFELALGDVGN